MTDVSGGVLMALLAGILNGSFASPTKCTYHWRWENIWAIWAAVALIIFPWSLGFLTVPDLLGLYRSAGVAPLLVLVGLGIGFGLSQIFFGLGIDAIGISLSFAISIGISTALGPLLPLVLFQSDTIFALKGLLIIGGVLVVLIGIVVCGTAGRAKEKVLLSLDRSREIGTFRTKFFRRGFLLSVLAGVGSPMVNFGLVFGAPLIGLAARRGVPPESQANSVWPPLLTATAIPFAGYCLYLWKRNRSFPLFAREGTASYWLLGALMGILWMGSVALYGAASDRMGYMGPILGWPLFMSVIIITSNAWGLVTGEWKGVSKKPITIMAVGIFFLIIGFCTLAVASRVV